MIDCTIANLLKFKILIVILGLLLFINLSHADGCDIQILDNDHLDTGIITEALGNKVHFKMENTNCSKKQVCLKSLKSYLVNGDQVLVDKNIERDGHYCLAFGTETGKFIVGLIPKSNLQLTEFAPQDISDSEINGIWVNENGGIEIWKHKKDKIVAAGNISYQISETAPINVGEFAGPLEINKKSATVIDMDSELCKLSFKFNGKYLKVLDHGNNCGGLNITFSAYYTKLIKNREAISFRDFYDNTVS